MKNLINKVNKTSIEGLELVKKDLLNQKEIINDQIRAGAIDEEIGYKKLENILKELKFINCRLNGDSWETINQKACKEILDTAIKEAKKRFEERYLIALHQKDIEGCSPSSDVVQSNKNEIKEDCSSMDNKKIRVFEAFAGVGSQRMALRNLGIEHEVVGIAEIDKYALASYKAIHGDCPNFGDISKIEPHILPDMDLFTYSFPCQDLSVAGKQAGLGENTRSGLLYECEKVIEAKRPKYLLLENVKNLVGKKFKPEFDKWLEYLEGLGYKNYWDVLNAKNYSVPQNRERVFVVSILGNVGYKFPEQQELTKRIKDILEPVVDGKFYLSESVQARFKQTKEDNGINTVIGTTKPEFRTIGQRDDVYSINNTMGALVATDYKQPKQILDNYRVRKLTPLECWRLMGFSDDDFYKAQKVCSNTQLFKLAGNSIVVPVLEGIFKNLFL